MRAPATCWPRPGAEPKLGAIVRQRLATSRQLAERFIRHDPKGNCNRYNPQPNERFPKLVTGRDSIEINAIAAPLDPSDPVILECDGVRYEGEIVNDVWRFVLPPEAGLSERRYRLAFDLAPKMATEWFVVPVLARRRFRPSALAEKDGRIIVKGQDGHLVFSTRADGGFDVHIDPVAPADLPRGSTSEASLATDRGAVTVCLSPFSLTFWSPAKDDAISLSDADITWLVDASGRVVRVDLGFETPARSVFGLGERYNALNQYGQRVDSYVYNQYKDQGLRTYMPMPVFYTDAGYGAHLATDSYAEFDFGATRGGRFEARVEAPVLDLQLFPGTLVEQVSQFIDATGPVVEIPDWALGPWMSSNNWDSDAEVRKQVALTREHAIPATVLVIEAWSDEATFCIFNDATYAENDGSTALRYADYSFPDWGRWPDPKALMDDLHAEGLRVILWQIPVIKHVTSLLHRQKRADETHAIANNYVIRNADGSPYRLPEGWFKDGLLIDFTNPDARRWWFDKRAYLRDELGVDGFKTDGGEAVFGDDLLFADGTSGLEMRNRYPRDYISAYHRFAAETGGITFSRSGYTGAQSFPAHWAGDERSTWDAFKRSLLAGLSGGLSGVLYWGWDFAGFSGPIPSAELYIRGAQMACFCPIMQYHAESKAEFNQDRTPWNIAERTGDTRALSLNAFFANLRMTLMPYLRQESHAAAKARTPLMRAMALDYPDLPEVETLWDQYMFGRDLLVAPVIVEGATTRSVHLPPGRWWHLFEERWCEGGHVDVAAELSGIPVFVRDGATLPLAFMQKVGFGTAMPSGIGDHARDVILVTGRPAAPPEPLAASVRTWRFKDDGTFKLELAAPLARQTTLVFADAPTRLRVNGKQVMPSVLALSARQLTACDLPV